MEERADSEKGWAEWNKWGCQPYPLPRRLAAYLSQFQVGEKGLGLKYWLMYWTKQFIIAELRLYLDSSAFYYPDIINTRKFMRFPKFPPCGKTRTTYTKDIYRATDKEGWRCFSDDFLKILLRFLLPWFIIHTLSVVSML